MEYETADPSYLYKLVVIGDSGVGKSNLMTRYTSNEFFPDTPTTIGVEFMTKILSLDGREVRAQIWDTAGQEKFRAIARSVYSGAKGAMIVYDITNEASFQHVVSWIEDIKEHTTPEPILVLVGNKSDLAHLRVVETQSGERVAAEHGICFLETSARDSTNVDKAFEWLVREVFRRHVGETLGLESLAAAADRAESYSASKTAMMENKNKNTVKLDAPAGTDDKTRKRTKKKCCK
eukprot:PhM_4_TR16506/c1_g1_i1/m.36493/K07904/RAB11A; Ras-related protein Rab-11A